MKKKHNTRRRKGSRTRYHPKKEIAETPRQAIYVTGEVAISNTPSSMDICTGTIMLYVDGSIIETHLDKEAVLDIMRGLGYAP